MGNGVSNLFFTALDHVSQKLDRILPDYLLVFAVPLLAHLPEFEDPSDVETLRKLQNALWFVMEPLMTKNDNFSFSFYKAIIDEMKTRRDKTAPEDDGVNVVCFSCCTGRRRGTHGSCLCRNCGLCATSH